MRGTKLFYQVGWAAVRGVFLELRTASSAQNQAKLAALIVVIFILTLALMRANHPSVLSKVAQGAQRAAAQSTPFLGCHGKLEPMPSLMEGISRVQGRIPE